MLSSPLSMIQRGQVIEDTELPLKYSRKTLSQDEIEIIEVSLVLLNSIWQICFYNDSLTTDNLNCGMHLFRIVSIILNVYCKPSTPQKLVVKN